MLSNLLLFPLNTVLVPGLVMPLHIFEERYRNLVELLLAEPDEESREFGIIAIRDGMSVEADGITALYEVGTATLLRQVERFEDGRFDIVTTGSRRFRLHEVDSSQPLARGIVEFLDEPTDMDDPIVAQQVAQLFTVYRNLLGGRLDTQSDADSALEIEAGDDLPDDPTVLSYLVTAAMVLPTPDRQQLLATPDTLGRLTLARSILSHENALIAGLGAVPAIDLLSAPTCPN